MNKIMHFLNKLILHKKITGKDKKDRSTIHIFSDKYSAFQNLLKTNNHVLEMMADLEEKKSGEYLFDRHYIVSRTKTLSENVLNIINLLNALSRDKYRPLHTAYLKIASSLDSVLHEPRTIPKSHICLPLERVDAGMAAVVGGKMSHLGDVKNRLGLPVPDGFCVSAWTFKLFMDQTDCAAGIAAILASIDANSMESVNNASREIQAMVSAAPLPAEIQQAIDSAVRREVEKQKGQPLTFAVRSSAIHEDGEFTFAGQYATFLGVLPEEVGMRYRDVVASLFSPRAIYYYVSKGFALNDMVMAVGVVQMVDAAVGGVLYTREPHQPTSDHMIVNAVRGLGKPVVDGTVRPDAYVLNRSTGTMKLIKAGDSASMFSPHPGGGIRESAVPAHLSSQPCVTDEIAAELARVGLLLERHFNGPQDIEWAWDSGRGLIVLQSRPLRTFAPPSEASVPRRIEGRRIIIEKGIIACRGIGYGTAFILKHEDELDTVPEGAVLVAKHTSTRFVTVMGRVQAILTDVGGIAGHMASLAREYGVPTIVDTEVATSLLLPGQEITVDAYNCNVYEGKVEELIGNRLADEESFRNTRLFGALENVLRLIVPLSLLDPEDPGFAPESCKTYHDITRFCHEKAMGEMFTISEGYDTEGFRMTRLSAGIPMQAYVLDIGGGLLKTSALARPEDLSSLPFLAFLAGMKSMKWPGPRPMDAKGFMGMVAHTASIQEDELRRAGEKSFAVISRDYMNFSIRLGYHFSQVEAYVGETVNDNYIRFFFSGGGAARDRRLRRVALIRKILHELGFSVRVTEDVVRAGVSKYRRNTLEDMLTAMGKLTAYTKQLDMALFNDTIAEWYADDFIAWHLQTAKPTQG